MQEVMTLLGRGSTPDLNRIVYIFLIFLLGLISPCEASFCSHGGAGGAGGLLLIRETKGTTTTDLYPLYDGAGNVTALADTTGALQAEYAYGPSGETLYARGPKAASCPFRFATKYYDPETGFYNFGKRFYDPITGQFLSREPLGEKESLNLYSYCHNDPINYVDVLGLAPKWMTEAQGKVYDDMVREAIQSGNFSSNLSSDILRAMAADGILPDSSAAEDERLGIYYGTVGKVALNHPNFVSTAGILSSAVVGIIKTIPGNGPEGGGATDGSNSTGALVFDTFRLNANSLVALGNPGSSSVQNGFSEFHEGYNKKYSYKQRSFAQGASLAASILMPTAIAQSKAALASSPGWSTKLAPRLNPLNYRVAAGELYSGVPRLQFTGVKGGSKLVHMSIKADDILASGKLGLPSNNYAGPALNAGRSGWSLTAQTGLSPGGSYGAVPIPTAGNSAFSKVVPIGPMTTWQRLTGQEYTARGIMDLNSGAFTRSGLNWNQIGIYSTDAAITGGAIGGSIYLWNESR